jgi:polyhydroxyalkanoate synthesis regulator phasin
MAPWHGEESDFEMAFRLNAAPLFARIEKLEQQVKKLKKARKALKTQSPVSPE